MSGPEEMGRFSFMTSINSDAEEDKQIMIQYALDSMTSINSFELRDMEVS